MSAYATAGALVFVGILMASSLIEVKWDDLTEATPAFITTAMMPFTYSITEGIAFGFISYCVRKPLQALERNQPFCFSGFTSLYC